MVRFVLLTFIAAVLALPAAAHASPFLPPPGKLFAGVSGGYEAASFERETGAHPAVFQFFGGWNQTTEYMFEGATTARSRLMIHLSTMRGTEEQITPRGIARGLGDDYLLTLGRRIDAYGGLTYIRLMAEMDGYWNAYCAYTASGRSKGPAYTTAQFRQAWRRTVLVLRGGPLARVNSKLHALHLPPVRGSGGRDLPEPKVSFLWVPQVAGAPDTQANSPRAYWPGGRYVDWIGTDFYSKFPNWGGLERFYRAYGRHKPFAFGEWALWDRDDPAFVHRLFAWSRSHRRVRMLMYNQGKLSNGPFRLVHYPRARRALKAELRRHRIAGFAPELLP